MKDPMSLRLGPLAGPVVAAAKAAGQSPSEWLREAASEKLGVKAPAMPQGFAAMSETTAAKARKKSAKTRRAAKSG